LKFFWIFFPARKAQDVRREEVPSEALDVLYREMRPASYHRIRMAIEIASYSPAFFVVANLLLPITTA
jgi:hypothetical protein